MAATKGKAQKPRPKRTIVTEDDPRLAARPQASDTTARKKAIKATKKSTVPARKKANLTPAPKTKTKGKKCGARNRGTVMVSPNEFCQQPAGARTAHPGYGKCWRHGGNAPAGITEAEREMVEARMAVEAGTYGGHVNIGPQEALLQEVQRTAGHVIWLEAKVKSLDESNLTQYTGKDGMKESEWIKMYQEERKMLVNVCNTAIRCGIAERQVRIVEEQGKMIAAMLIKLINDSSLDLSPEQRLVAPKICRNLLMEISSGTLEAPQQDLVSIGGEIVDAEVVG